MRSPHAGTISSSVPHVLVVDDFQDTRELFAEYLEFLGYQTSQAGDGREAIERALATKPDVILMDIAMPVMDGTEATRWLKSHDETAAIPVIAVTGQVQRLTAAKICEQCDATLVKPVPLPELESEIRRVLAR
jgi:two-component system cell cycle response regulator DivK